MIKYLLKLIPPHRVYVEPFAGGAKLLFAKPPSKVEVINDVYEDLINFYRVLRDPEKSAELKRLLQLTPYARKEFYFCRDYLHENGISDVERARRFFVMVRQSFSGDLKTWGYGINRARPNPFTFMKVVDDFDHFSKRLRHVYIECDDFEKIFQRYDSEETFFYCDPPYVIKTTYRSPPYPIMSDGDHRRLVKILLSVKGKVLLSGFPHKIYEPLNSWHKIRIKTYASVKKVKKARRTRYYEWLWLNYDIPREFIEAFGKDKRVKIIS